MYFSAKLAQAALLAVTASAQSITSGGAAGMIDAADQDALFPVLAGAFYGDYTWESHRVVTAKGYEKILFRLTGKKSDPEYKATKGPVLFISGATTNATSNFDQTASKVWNGKGDEIGLTRDQWAELFEQKLETLLSADTGVDLKTSYLLADMQTRVPEDKWTELTKAWKKAKIDWEAAIAVSQDSLNFSETTQECIIDNYAANSVNQYLDSLEDGKGDTQMPEQSNAMQIDLFNAGYDIWWDGNRGTLYQRGHSNPDITDDEYWDFSLYDQATDDQPAQINYVLESTGAETLSYIGYSMGTMQMYYNLATAAEDDALFETTKKVEKFLAITPCAYTARPPEVTMEGMREYLLATDDILEENDMNFIFGEGTNVEGSTEYLCYGIPKEECLFASLLPFMDTLSVGATRQANWNNAEQNMLKDRADYAIDGVYPTADDYVDFTKVSRTNVYHFVAENDATCLASQAQRLADEIPTFKKAYTYPCEEQTHEWFPSRGLGQSKFNADLIAALDIEEEEWVEPQPVDSGARTLTAAISAMAVLALAMF